jgi:hypothetical protein
MRYNRQSDYSENRHSSKCDGKSGFSIHSFISLNQSTTQITN